MFVKIVHQLGPDAIHLNVFRTVHLISDAGGVPVVLDLDEIRSEYYAQLRAEHTHIWWRVLGRYEAPRMARQERDLIGSGVAILLSKVSTDVAASTPNLFEVPSVSLNRAAESSKTRDSGPITSLVFVGRFSYEANVESVMWFVANCWPPISRALPQLRLKLVGPDAPIAIRRMASESIEVTGYVHDMIPYYESAVAIVPLFRATGVQMKLIEALAEHVPTVCTPIVAELAGVTDSNQVLVAASPSEWVASILRLVADEALRGQLSRNGEAWVADVHSWKALEGSLARAYEFAVAHR